MKIISATTKQIYDINVRVLSGEARIPCPECSDSRKKPSEKCFAWNVKDQRGFCHHCNTSFFAFLPGQSNKQYFVPEWKNITDLSDKAVKYFEGRMIKQSVLKKMKVYTTKEYMQQFNKEIEVIAFPYFRNNKLVNTKFRGAEKSFKLIKNAELVFYNIDSIIDSKDVIITEGEIDALCFIQAGFEYCISVPNGANIKAIEYLDNCIDLITSKEKVYLATDNDIKGITLRDELARRIGYEKCLIVNFKDTKDANEYLLKYGADFMTLLKDAKLIKIKGISEPLDMYSETKEYFNIGIQRGLTIGINEIDDYITWETGRLAVVTGIPSHGKSSVVDFIVAKLNILYGWKAGFFTPENFPMKYHIANLIEVISGQSFSSTYMKESIFDQTYNYVNDNFRYILDEDDFTSKTILSLAKVLVRQYGIKVLVIDPFNKIEHKNERWENETQYISRFLDELTSFAKFNHVLIFLIAHPRKIDMDGSKYRTPNLYDISGSAHFYNKCDYGFTVYREKNLEGNSLSDNIEVYWQKVKHKNLGKTGSSLLKYNFQNARFDNRNPETLKSGEVVPDIKNWLNRSSDGADLPNLF